MNKNVLVGLGAVALLLLISVGVNSSRNQIFQLDSGVGSGDIDAGESASGYLSTTYTLGGESVDLEDGYSEQNIASGSDLPVITEYFGNEVRTDLNDDGREDVVFVLTQRTGGSGTFFYAVAALNTEAGWIGSDGYLLGDRIAPQTTEVSQNPNHQNVIVVNYADRAEGEPMTAEPSKGVSVYLKLDLEAMRWGVVQADFEGEADPNVMTLDMKTWTWVRTQYNNDTELVPKQADAFTLTFDDNGTVAVTTDCNSMRGTYEVADSSITFGEMAATKMYCEGSQESEFANMLREVQLYFFTNRGELIFDLKYDSGSSVFR